MITAVAFVVVAGVATTARALVTSHVNPDVGVPWGTLLVNASGAFLLGLATGLEDPAATVLGVAALGAYTTFSTFSVEVVRLLSIDRYSDAAVYVGATLLLCPAVAMLGIALVD